MTSWMKINFQDSMSPIMFHLNFFHDYILLFIIMILLMIFYIIMFISKTKFYSNLIINHQLIETIWTLIPLIILMFLIIPSIKILYMTEDMKNIKFTIKSIGNQWYWTYEYPQLFSNQFDSFMINNINYFRLLSVDNNLFSPSNIKIRLLTTSNDVIHSFTIPSLGFKMDSIPGRLNQNSFYINSPGLFVGQCSEICGMNHSFMPIILESIKMKSFSKLIKNL
uniref:Cytochrome c oxidase subunit 2 n=1 Tax=Scelio sp. ZJUH_2016028 TaxID=2496283 RepID=A0A3S8V166_9HYME|nr:cytochrome c oxidase subunit 2 [Scelio sp. ZJUH_2016028]